MRFLSCLFLCLLMTAPAFADEASDIARAESYLQGLSKARARFVQIAPDGSERNGTFYLNRPGRLRFEYDPPVKDFVVADGTFIYFYDSELKEQSNAPIGQTLADFILRDNLTMSGDLAVQSVSRGGGLLQIELAQSADPMAGKLRLGFLEQPFSLKKWRVTDAQGAVTEVILEDLQTDVQLDKKLFYYVDPSRDVIRYNN